MDECPCFDSENESGGHSPQCTLAKSETEPFWDSTRTGLVAGDIWVISKDSRWYWGQIENLGHKDTVQKVTEDI